MKNLSQIEVEPLSDQRWSKIERSLIARIELEKNAASTRSLATRPRVSGRAWLFAAALASALGVAVYAVRGLPERAVVEQPSRITTGTSSSHLALPGLSLDVEPQSAVVVGAETPRGLLIVVDRGSIVCEVAPRQQDAPLIVQAGAARVRVLGTRFSVTRVGENARVRVQDGVVEVASGGRSWRVQSGEEWPAEMARFGATESVAVPHAAPPAPGDEQRLAPTERPIPTAPRARSASEIPSARPVPATRPTPQAVFEQATALERSDPGRASELYRTLESGGDSWAQNALYARGRLEASRGNRSEARRLLESYLERFPRGSNSEDARAVLKRLR